MNDLIINLAASVLFALIGYALSEVKHHHDMHRKFRKGILTAIDAVEQAEREFGSQKGKEKFGRAIDLYMDWTGEKDRDRAAKVVKDAFEVSRHWHES